MLSLSCILISDLVVANLFVHAFTSRYNSEFLSTLLGCTFFKYTNGVFPWDYHYLKPLFYSPSQFSVWMPQCVYTYTCYTHIHNWSVMFLLVIYVQLFKINMLTYVWTWCSLMTGHSVYADCFNRIFDHHIFRVYPSFAISVLIHYPTRDLWRRLGLLK